MYKNHRAAKCFIAMGTFNLYYRISKIQSSIEEKGTHARHKVAIKIKKGLINIPA